MRKKKEKQLHKNKERRKSFIKPREYTQKRRERERERERERLLSRGESERVKE